MKIPVVVIRIPLYTRDGQGSLSPMGNEAVQDVVGVLEDRDDFLGYAITSVTVEYEEVEDEAD
jgi:hypothetical protein